MAVVLNTTNILRNPSSNIAFGSSKEPSAKFVPQAGDEFVLKSAKQAVHKNQLSNLARALMLTFGMGIAGTAITGCTPEDTPTLPVNPKDTTVVVDTTKTATLTPLQKQFNRVMAPVFALDTTNAAAVDSLLVSDETLGGLSAYGVDKKKSTPDTIVMRETQISREGRPSFYFITEYTKDGEKLSAKLYKSCRDFSKKIYVNTLKYAQDGNSTIEDKTCRYTLQSANQSVKTFFNDSTRNYIIKRLH